MVRRWCAGRRDRVALGPDVILQDLAARVDGLALVDALRRRADPRDRAAHRAARPRRSPWSRRSRSLTARPITWSSCPIAAELIARIRHHAAGSAPGASAMPHGPRCAPSWTTRRPMSPRCCPPRWPVRRSPPRGGSRRPARWGATRSASTGWTATISRSSWWTSAVMAWVRPCCRCRCSTCSTRAPCPAWTSVTLRRCSPGSTRHSPWSASTACSSPSGTASSMPRRAGSTTRLPPIPRRSCWRRARRRAPSASPTCPSVSMEGVTYTASSATVPAGSRLVVISDGAFEVRLPDDGSLSYADFVGSGRPSDRDGPARARAGDHRVGPGACRPARVRGRLHPPGAGPRLTRAPVRASSLPLDSANVDAVGPIRCAGSRGVATGVTPSRRQR